MQPLTKNSATTLLTRVDNFIDAEIVSLDIVSPNEMSLTLNAQDKSRDFDWIKIKLLFSSITDAKLVDNISFLDISDGVSILIKNKKIFFAIGQYTTESSLKESIFFIEADSVKVGELAF